MDSFKIGFVMDPIKTINPKKDSTLAIMLEAQARGWELFYMELNDLFLENEKAKAELHSIKLENDTEEWFEITNSRFAELGDLDVIFMRKDPPFDIEYIMATYILEKAKEQGAWVINDPKGLRDANEKVFTSNFPKCIPPGIITRKKNTILNFLVEYPKAVIKPTCKMGGQSVFILSKEDPNLHVIIEEVTKNESVYVQVQKYISAISESGDKRILMINGEPIEYGLSRIPSKDDHRGNLVAGAKGKIFKLSEKDRWICSQIGPRLKEMGLVFVGIDIIGEFLTEINVTSPTCIREIDRDANTNIASQLLNFIDQQLNSNP